MDRKQFINELRTKLVTLPYDEREKAISYYEEYFDDAGAENEDSVIYELGDIERIAQEIIENSTSSASSLSANKFVVGDDDIYNSYSSNKNYDKNKENSSANSKVIYNYEEKPKKAKEKLGPVHIVLMVIGAIVCFPIIMSFFGLLMGLFGVIIGIIATAFGLVISGIAAVFTLPFVGIAAVGSILYYLGKGILSIALLVIIIIVIVKLIKAIIDFIKNRAD